MIGFVADSHNRLCLLKEAVDFLKGLAAGRIIHLGDICDSLDPGFLEQAAVLIHEENIEALRGNNECVVLTEFVPAHPGFLGRETLSFLENLPYTIRIGDLSCTHSAPFDWPEATRRPLRYYLPRLMAQGSLPFRILFRGHSHRPSVLEIHDAKIEKIPVSPGEEILFHPDKKYIVTVGAIERGACALFDRDRNLLRLLEFADK
jgi:predicted phosphodiesterase